MVYTLPAMTGLSVGISQKVTVYNLYYELHFAIKCSESGVIFHSKENVKSAVDVALGAAACESGALWEMTVHRTRKRQRSAAVMGGAKLQCDRDGLKHGDHQDNHHNHQMVVRIHIGLLQCQRECIQEASRGSDKRQSNEIDDEESLHPSTNHKSIDTTMKPNSDSQPRIVQLLIADEGSTCIWSYYLYCYQFVVIVTVTDDILLPISAGVINKSSGTWRDFTTWCPKCGYFRCLWRPWGAQTL